MLLVLSAQRSQMPKDFCFTHSHVMARAMHKLDYKRVCKPDPPPCYSTYNEIVSVLSAQAKELEELPRLIQTSKAKFF